MPSVSAACQVREKSCGRSSSLPSTKLLFSFLVPCHRTYGRRADLARFGVRRTATRNRPTVSRHTSRARLYPTLSRSRFDNRVTGINCVIHSQNFTKYSVSAAPSEILQFIANCNLYAFARVLSDSKRKFRAIFFDVKK